MSSYSIIQKVKAVSEKMYSERIQLDEKIHPKLQAILDSDLDPSRKMVNVIGTAQLMKKDKEPHGLKSFMPKRGSSRGVFFPQEPHQVTVDGVPTKMHSAVKVAYPGWLDTFNDSGKLFGEHQNELESDHSIHQTYGVLTHGEKEGEYRTNPHGILPPHIKNHADHHYIEMGKVDPYSHKDFKEGTKTYDFPQGISHKEFSSALNHYWEDAHGNSNLHGRQAEAMEKLMDHPMVHSAVSLIANSDMHPADLEKTENFGIFKHPVTGKKSPVILDYGYSNKVSKLYRKSTLKALGQEPDED